MKTTILSLLLLGMTPFAYAQNSADHPRQTALWKVASAHRTIYITGSVGASLEKYPVPEIIIAAFEKSGELIMEGKTHANKKKMAGLLRKYGLQPSGEKLNDDLDSSQVRLVKKALSSLSVRYTLADLQVFQPWFAVMVLHNGMYKSLRPHAKQHALFEYFHSRADSAGMPVTFLNTVAGEVKLYARMPQVAWLMMMAKRALKPNQARKRALTKMTQAWRSGHTAPVATYYNKTYREYPEVYNTLVTSYEPRWLKTLKSELNEDGKPVFVIVNADNLVGPVNILNGLRKAGYQVSQL